MYVYMEITKDIFELPCAVADGPTELARLCHVTARHVCHAIKAGGRQRFIKVWIEDENEQEKM